MLDEVSSNEHATNVIKQLLGITDNSDIVSCNIQVNGGAYVNAVRDLLGTAGKGIITVKVKGSQLELQTTVGSSIKEDPIDFVSCDAPNGTMFTYESDTSFTLLSVKHDLTIHADGSFVTIKQGTFEYRTEQSNVESVDIGIEGEYKSAATSSISNLVYDSKALDGVAKMLAKDTAPINFKDGWAYIYYKTTLLRTKCDFANMQATSQVIRDLQKYIAGSSNIEYKVDYERGRLLAKNGSKLFSTTISELDDSLAHSMDTLIKSIDTPINIDMSAQYDLMEAITKVYTNVAVTLGVCKTGFKFSVDSRKSTITVGVPDEAIISMKISSQQLTALTRSMKNCRVLIGWDTHRMLFNAGNKQLLFSGIIF